jgi:purine-nucleoside/S-methyl-5'-thioadenosine phosphorylase / adenosine deaminase
MVKYLQDENFSQFPFLKHGFFTRQGGVSQGPYDSLNCGFTGDKQENVLENRRRAMAAGFGLSLDRLVTHYQVHSAKVISVTAPYQGRIEGDGIVTNQPNVVLGVTNADCPPVLFVDPENRIIGAAHAGWKGAFAGIIDSMLDVMSSLGAKTENIHAVIGPAIDQKSYEVDQKFYQQFIKQDPLCKNLFIENKDPCHYLFNLKEFIKTRLKQNNINYIYQMDHNTYDQNDLFFSRRRSFHENEDRYGVCLAAISLII